MPTGHSIHIGLNYVNPAHYDGWDGELAACEFDAADMLGIAKKQGFSTRKSLIREAATSTAVLAALSEAASRLKSGDLLLVTYSGHGGQVPDTNGDEQKVRMKDRKDETWCLFDRMLVDDELYACWAKFKKGVRIFVLSDSCHSGTVTRAMPAWVDGRPAPRLMPVDVNARVAKKHAGEYRGIQAKAPAAETAKLAATVILISGCQDNQTSGDGDRNGVFTGALRSVWRNGKFKGTHRDLRDHITARIGEWQSPNYFVSGAPNAAFENAKPFTI